MRLQVAALTLLLLQSCSRSTDTKGVAIDRSLEKLIPSDTVVLAGFHTADLMKTPIYQRLMEQQRLPAELEEFTKETGLDPRRDVEQVLFASSGDQPLLIARLRIADPQAVEKALEQKGANRIPLDKYTMFGKDGRGVVFVDRQTAIAGDAKQIRKALAGGPPSALLEKVAALPGRKHVWAVATGGFSPMPLPETGNMANLKRVFASLETTTLALDLENGVVLSASGLCGDDANARQLHDTLRGLIGFGRLSTPDDKPEMLRLFDAIKVEQKQREVNVEADIPMDLVDILLKIIGPRPRA